MEILTLLALIAGVSLLIFVYVRRSRSKDMYIKRQHHIQAFPPGHRDAKRK